MSWINSAFDETSPDLGASLDDPAIFNQSSNSSLACRSSHSGNSQPLFGSPISAAKDASGNGASSSSLCFSILDSSHHQTGSSLLGIPSTSGTAVRNGSSHVLSSASSLFPLTFLERSTDQPVKSASSVLLVQSEVGPSLSDAEDSEDLVTSCPIPDLDNMTANELCEDIAYTHHSLGLMATAPGHPNGLDEPPQLVSPPQSVSHNLGEASSNLPSPSSEAPVTPSSNHSSPSSEASITPSSVAVVSPASSSISSIVMLSPTPQQHHRPTAITEKLSTRKPENSNNVEQIPSSLPNTSGVHDSSDVISSPSLLLQTSVTTPSHCSFSTPKIGSNKLSSLSESCQSLRLSFSPTQASQQQNVAETSSSRSSEISDKSSVSSTCENDPENSFLDVSSDTKVSPHVLNASNSNYLSPAMRGNGAPSDKQPTSSSGTSTTASTTAPTSVLSTGASASGRGISGGAGGSGGSGDEDREKKKTSVKDKEEDSTSHETSNSSDSSQESRPRQAGAKDSACTVSTSVKLPVPTPRSSILRLEKGLGESSSSHPQPPFETGSPLVPVQLPTAPQTTPSSMPASSAITILSNPSTSKTQVPEAAATTTSLSGPVVTLSTSAIATVPKPSSSSADCGSSIATPQRDSSTTYAATLRAKTAPSSNLEVVSSAPVLPSLGKNVVPVSDAGSKSQDLFESEDLQSSNASAYAADTQDEDDVLEASLEVLQQNPSTAGMESKQKSSLREHATALDSSSSSTSSVDPDSNSSSDAKVLVDYSKLKKKKDFEISPTLERRRKGISEVSFKSPASRKIAFTDSEGSDVPGEPNVPAGGGGDVGDEGEVTVLDSFNESLEVVYDTHHRSSHRSSAQAEPSETLGSQDMHLFLSRDTQGETQSLVPRASASSTSAAEVASSDDLTHKSRGDSPEKSHLVVKKSRDDTAEKSRIDAPAATTSRETSASFAELSQLSRSESLRCHDVLSSSTSDSQCYVEDSQVPAGTINPTQLASLLSETEPPVHSQSPDIEPLLSNPVHSKAEVDPCREEVLLSEKPRGSSSISKGDLPKSDSHLICKGDKGSAKVSLLSSEKEESQSDISPSIEIIEKTKPKFKSPSKYKDQCHQSLVMESTPSQPCSSDSSSSSSSSHSNGIVGAQESFEMTAPKARGSSGVPSFSKPCPDLSTETLKLPEINPSQLEGPSSLPCSGTIIAKASKAAQENILAAERRNTEELQQCMQPRDTIKSLSTEQQALDDRRVIPENLPEEKEEEILQEPECHSSKYLTPESEVVSKKLKSKDGKTSLSSSSGAIESVSGKNIGGTSTPNESRVAAGISPSISEEGGSYIEKDQPSSSSLDEAVKSKDIPDDVMEEPLPKTTSTRSTVELSTEDLSRIPSFKSIEEVQSKGFVLQEVLELKVWRDPSDNSILYTSERGDEELIARSLPFVRKVSSKSKDKRMSDVSATTSSSSGYNADKSSSSSGSSRRMSSLTQAESISTAKSRLSIESVQVLQSGDGGIVKKFALPSNRPFKTKSPRVPSNIPEETSSSEERGDSVPRTLGYGSFRAMRGKLLNKTRIKSTIPEHPEPSGEAGFSGSTELVDLTGVDGSEQKRETESRDSKPSEHKPLPKTGIANKGLHYELDKFFGDLEDPIIDVLRSVQLSEEEEETFLSEDVGGQVSLLDIHEEQARMVINRMISITLAPNMLVFAKYHDHYYSAIIESEHPSGGWHIRFTLDGCQKHCPIEHILPIDILPRGQHCFRRFQGPSCPKSIVSVDVIIKGHTVENNTVLHIAADTHQTFKVPHSHLSMNLNDAERFVNAWKVTQSIVSTGPEVSLNNIVCGKRRRAPASGSPSLVKVDATSGTPTTPSKMRSVRKKRKQKGDPNLDTSLTETDVTVTGDGEEQVPDLADTDVDFSDSNKRFKKRRTLDDEEPIVPGAASVYETTPVRSRVHPRVREVLAEEVSEEDDPSDDETYSVASKSSKRASSRKKSRTTPKKKITARRLAVSIEVNPNLSTPEPSLPGHSVEEASVSSKPEVSERLVSDGEEDAGDDKLLPRKRGRKPKRKAQDLAHGEPSQESPSSIPQTLTPKKRGRPPGGGESSTTSAQKQAKLDDGRSTPRRRTDSGDDTFVDEVVTPAHVRRARTRSRSSDVPEDAEPIIPSRGVSPITQSSTPEAHGSRLSPSRSSVTKGTPSPGGSRSGRGRQGRKDRRAGLRSRLDVIEEGDAAASPYKDDHLLDPSADPRLGTIPPKGSTIFQGYTVLITDSGAGKPRGLNDDSGDEDEVPPLNRRHLTEQVRAGGGVVITKFEEADLIRVRQATFSGGSNSGNESSVLLLLCDKPCRTTKYIQCLLVGIPIVSHRWVITASDMNQRRDWESFVLPAGLNIVTNSMVEQNTAVLRHRPGDMVRDSPLLEGDVVFVATSSNPRFAETWLPLLGIAAAEVRRPPKSASSLGRVLDRKTTIVLADASIPNSELTRAKHLGKPVVSSEWFIQSVVVGYKLPCDYHPTFRHDASPSA